MERFFRAAFFTLLQIVLILVIGFILLGGLRLAEKADVKGVYLACVIVVSVVVAFLGHWRE